MVVSAILDISARHSSSRVMAATTGAVHFNDILQRIRNDPSVAEEDETRRARFQDEDNVRRMVVQATKSPLVKNKAPQYEVGLTKALDDMRERTLLSIVAVSCGRRLRPHANCLRFAE
eukprot:PLAT6682.3.p4 GENE.PLAT6682.3~~PLAT6682.3.p4  ORF type:complete len:118 (+),score=47.86 PLAT6682.3:133-486(+)